MKILVAANRISGAAQEGGSSRFMGCVIDELKNQGHTVVTDKKEQCDMMICSHDFDTSVKARKVFISHGILEDERCRPGADRYISISEEVRHVNKARGFNSDVVNQPINILKRSKINNTLENILIIRDVENLISDPFEFLHKKYNVKNSDMSVPIEDQIKKADLCITLGRGALESMTQGIPVLVADNRHYQGAIGDGYVNAINIKEIAKHNFSGRRFKIPITEGWILSELEKYNPDDSKFLYDYVSENHNVENIVKKYLEPSKTKPFRKDVAFGCMVNDMKRFDMVLKGSSIGRKECFTIFEPETAAKGLNTLLDIIEKSGAEVGILTHQDMFYQEHWLPQVKKQLAKLPEDWVIAGIVGKDENGVLCGKFHDMSSPLWIVSDHDFPVRCSCIDECTIIVNMKSGFRFDEEMIGFDLYGTYACLMANKIGSAWIIDAWAEHYCRRFFGSWEPDDTFKKMFKWLYNRFPGKRIDSTVLVGEKNDNEK